MSYSNIMENNGISQYHIDVSCSEQCLIFLRSTGIIRKAWV